MKITIIKGKQKRVIQISDTLSIDYIEVAITEYAENNGWYNNKKSALGRLF